MKKQTKQIRNTRGALRDAKARKKRVSSTTKRADPPFAARTYDTLSQWRSRPLLLGGGIAGAALVASILFKVHVAIGGLSFLVLALAVAVLAFGWSRTHVGVDGVAVWWFGRTRFIPIAEITGARAILAAANTSSESISLNEVIIHLRSGGVYKLPTNNRAFSGDDLPKEIVAQIEHALRLAESNRVQPSPSLLRDDRSHTEWVSALRTGSEADFRTAAVPRTHLFAVIEDGTASPLDRLAAMIALGPATTDEELARLDRIAARFVGPELKRALEVGPAADEATLARLLADVERGAIRRTSSSVAQPKVQARSEGREPLVDEDAVEEVVVPPQDTLHSAVRMDDLEPKGVVHGDVFSARRVVGFPQKRWALFSLPPLALLMSGAVIFAAETSAPWAWVIAAFFGVLFMVAASLSPGRGSGPTSVTLRFSREGFDIESPFGQEHLARIWFAEIAEVVRAPKSVPFGIEVRTRDGSAETLVLTSDAHADQVVRQLEKLARDASERAREARSKKQRKRSAKARQKKRERRPSESAEEEQVEVEAVHKRDRARNA